MPEIQFENGVFDVDAHIIGRGLGLPPERIPSMMRDGEISSRSERGEGEDAGRYRLTFFHKKDRFHVVVDESGRILDSSAKLHD